MKNTNYVEGRYYSGFGTYLGTRITHTMNKKDKKDKGDKKDKKVKTKKRKSYSF